MKTLLKCSLVALLLAFAPCAEVQAFGRPKADAVMYQSSLYTDAAGKLRLAVDKQAGGSVSVRLINVAGKEYFLQRIGKNQRKARIRIDISALSDGAYQVVLTNGVTSFTNHLTITTELPGFSGRWIALN
ncbi:hypothetical protein ACFPMF_23960 [Larkinella bovis]|uniref:Secretion system C-terminal sorting domain-containing protein n=1 Tax=Larkinella bovis TaxID=683041 RepID=A0ABW0IGK3_9BACT